MSDLLPEALQAMLKHAAESHAANDYVKAEIEYLLALQYSTKIYYAASATTGLVLLRLLDFYETTGQKSKAAFTIGNTNAILHAYNSLS